MTVDELMAAFNAHNDKDLGAIFSRTNKAVSKWRKNGEIPAAIEKKANELLRERMSPTQQVMNPPAGTHKVVRDISIKSGSEESKRQQDEQFIKSSLYLLSDDQVEMLRMQVMRMMVVNRKE